MKGQQSLENLIEELQYRYAWLLADFNTLFKTKTGYEKNTVWAKLYDKAKEANTRLLTRQQNREDAHELIGAYWVLQSVMDDELGYTAKDKKRRESIIQSQFSSATIHKV